jgi:hypothetical protein
VGNETLEKKLVSQDMKAIKRNISIATAGAFISGALLASAANYFMQDKIGISLAQAGVACAPILLAVYPCLSDTYSIIRKYTPIRD